MDQIEIGAIMNVDEPGTLLKQTMKLLKKDDRAVRQIVSDTGLPYPWIQSMRFGEPKGANVNRIQVLYEYLTGEKLIKTN